VLDNLPLRRVQNRGVDLGTGRTHEAVRRFGHRTISTRSTDDFAPTRGDLDRRSRSVDAVDEVLDEAGERQLGATLFNGVWELLDKADRSAADDDRMLHMAHASRHHWGAVGEPAHLARGEWQCSRVYAALGRAEPCRHHAERVLALCGEHDLGDWDLAFGHEARARALAIAGDLVAARAEAERAIAVEIADDEDRELLLADLATIPGLAPFWT
jgi:hypothetical protein